MGADGAVAVRVSDRPAERISMTLGTGAALPEVLTGPVGDAGVRVLVGTG